MIATLQRIYERELYKYYCITLVITSLTISVLIVHDGGNIWLGYIG